MQEETAALIQNENDGLLATGPGRAHPRRLPRPKSGKWWGLGLAPG